ncbi:hypothetical protein [Spirillospora sp. NPDC029432]|uniref:hypothetical protein n=1 Tax=Spirillospora sp. NPDC029432 TaxID=3154599 RepID=UPI003455DB5A
MVAFRDCMKKNGATVAENARPGALETSDPKIAKALEACRALLPSQSPGPSPS